MAPNSVLHISAMLLHRAWAGMGILFMCALRGQPDMKWTHGPMAGLFCSTVGGDNPARRWPGHPSPGPRQAELPVCTSIVEGPACSSLGSKQPLLGPSDPCIAISMVSSTSGIAWERRKMGNLDHHLPCHYRASDLRLWRWGSGG